MMSDRGFIDYYDLLQVSPDCDGKTLESAYRHLAKQYHPDHAETPDTVRLGEIIDAYRVLRDREQRSKYDVLYRRHSRQNSDQPSGMDEDVDEQTALDDADDHARILKYLYKRRRQHAQDAGVVGYYLQEMLGCSDEEFDFHKWYLKEKGFISLTEHGTLAITIQGIDHVISTSRTARAEQRLIRQQAMPASDQS